MPRVPHLQTITPARVDSITRYEPGGMAYVSHGDTELRIGLYGGVEYSSQLIFENPLRGTQPEDESVFAVRLHVYCLHTYGAAGATVYIDTIPSSGLRAVVHLNSGVITTVPLLWNNRVEAAMRIEITTSNVSSAEYCKLDPDAWFEIRTLRERTP